MWWLCFLVRVSMFRRLRRSTSRLIISKDKAIEIDEMSQMYYGIHYFLNYIRKKVRIWYIRIRKTESDKENHEKLRVLITSCRFFPNNCDEVNKQEKFASLRSEDSEMGMVYIRFYLEIYNYLSWKPSHIPALDFRFLYKIIYEKRLKRDFGTSDIDG